MIDMSRLLCMQVIRRMQGKLQWLSEPLLVSSRRQSINPSGLSTPRSSAVMQVGTAFFQDEKAMLHVAGLVDVPHTLCPW
jgi:hypothetical protein